MTPSAVHLLSERYAQVANLWEESLALVQRLEDRLDQHEQMQLGYLGLSHWMLNKLRESLRTSLTVVQNRYLAGERTFGSAFSHGDEVSRVQFDDVFMRLQLKIIVPLRLARVDDIGFDCCGLLRHSDEVRDDAISTLEELTHRLLSPELDERARQEATLRQNFNKTLVNDGPSPPISPGHASELGTLDSMIMQTPQAYYFDKGDGPPSEPLPPTPVSPRRKFSYTHPVSSRQRSTSRAGGQSSPRRTRERSITAAMDYMMTAPNIPLPEPPSQPKETWISLDSDGSDSEEENGARHVLKAGSPQTDLALAPIPSIGPDSQSHTSESASSAPRIPPEGSAPEHQQQEEETESRLMEAERPAPATTFDKLPLEQRRPSDSSQHSLSQRARSRSRPGFRLNFGLGHRRQHDDKSDSKGSPDDNSPLYLPSEDNNYAGFCKGAWKLQTGQRKAMRIDTRPVGMYTNVDFWRCSKCDFAGTLDPNGREVSVARSRHSFDQRVYAHPCGVRYRWAFLAKSHVKAKRDRWNHTGKESFACIFCCIANRAVPPMFDDVNMFLRHVRLHGGDVDEDHPEAPSPKALAATKTVVGRVAEDSEDFDLNIPPLRRGSCNSIGSSNRS